MVISNQKKSDLIVVEKGCNQHENITKFHDKKQPVYKKTKNNLKQTEQIQIKKSSKKYKDYIQKLSKICRFTKNLYNLANYYVRQEFIKNRLWLRYYDLYKLLKETIDYKNLPSQTAQQTLRLLEKNWKSFFRAIKDWKKHPEKYLSRPKLPKYKKKNGEHIAIFTNQQCKIKDGFLIFPKKADLLPIKTRIINKINHVRILPRGLSYIIEIVYEKQIYDMNLDSKRVMGIDIGLSNLVTGVDNIGSRPFIIKGGIPKSINQFYNKLMAKYRSIKDKQGIKFETKRIQKLTMKRNNRIHDFFHKVSKKIINYCIQKSIGTIIIGYNENWKQKLKLGKRNNQNFVNIPFKKLINQIKYKSKLIGIKIIIVNEWYTSKVSALDLEKICKHRNYLGKRVYRGLFQSKKGVLLNADVNAALNIIRKYIGDIFIKENKNYDYWLRPKVWSINENLNFKKIKSIQQIVDIGGVNSPNPQSLKKRNEGMNSTNGNHSNS